jgi:hypothetical protein
MTVECMFLVDTGADFTVLNKATLDALQTTRLPPSEQVAGVGGTARSVDVRATIWFFRDGPERVAFHGQFAAVTDFRALDMSVLGRDITHHFALIVDWPGKVVCLVGQNHRYSVTSG